jgi:hypothetical protein
LFLKLQGEDPDSSDSESFHQLPSNRFSPEGITFNAEPLSARQMFFQHWKGKTAQRYAK